VVLDVSEQTVIVLGGTGIFGARVAEGLAATPGLRVDVAGRDREKGEREAARLGTGFRRCDLTEPSSLRECLNGAALLVHAAGPFQGRRYDVAEACLDAGVHYLDLSDARSHVCGVVSLDARAKERGLVIGAGASSVPTITHALVEEATRGFASIDTIDLALSPGNQNPRGVSTIAAVLSYLGAPQRVWIDGDWQTREGWGERRKLGFPPSVGTRGAYPCEVPDLELFPKAWRARTVRFYAGLELDVMNRTLTAVRRLRRWGIVSDPMRLAPLALRLSLLLYPFGSKNGALAAWVRGTDAATGKQLQRKVALVTDDDGPATPSAPAILLGRKLLVGTGLPAGAYPCMGHLNLSELLEHLEPKGIWCARGEGPPENYEGWYQ
jgi:hypothetical protein